jgi:hypothetical protein
LKHVLRQYELRERHYNTILRSKELEVLVAKARAEEGKQIAEEGVSLQNVVDDFLSFSFGADEASSTTIGSRSGESVRVDGETDHTMQRGTIPVTLFECVLSVGYSHQENPLKSCSPSSARSWKDEAQF